ncbi:MAG TPA: lysozyme inhibitor LprI family protein [Caulobacteraceae bacterium]|jgi:uncharacterized protein|nr:lysozyme inhibitor LprI family protein [Caulobacteraceae bacterium]
MSISTRGAVWTLGVAVILLIAVSGANAASFDCKKAADRIEHLICGDVDANAYDGQIGAAYQGALDRSSHPEEVRARQRAWLKQRDACADASCLTAAYKKQISLLSSLSDEPPTCEDGTTPAINACGAEYSRRADLELARYVAASRKRLLDDTADNPESQAAKTALPEFDAAQKAWETYRKAECGAAYDWWSDGTIRGAMFNACYLSATKARTEAIWETWLTYMDDTPALLPEPSAK